MAYQESGNDFSDETRDQQDKGEQRADHGPGVVQGAMKTEGAAAPIRQPPGYQLEQAGGALRHPFHQSDDSRSRSQSSGEKQRQQRCNHLAGGVVEKGGQTEDHHGAG